jgi:hypothetical protein
VQRGEMRGRGGRGGYDRGGRGGYDRGGRGGNEGGRGRGGDRSRFEEQEVVPVNHSFDEEKLSMLA